MERVGRDTTDVGVQQLLWAAGEARRLRLQGRGPRGRTGPAGATTPAGVLSVTTGDGRGLVTVVGRLDAANGPALLRIVHTLAARGTRRVVVDLSGADVLAAGVDVLARVLVYVERHERELVLKAPRAETLAKLSEAGMMDRFAFC